MKHLILIALLFMGNCTIAQVKEADKITGTYMTEKNKGKVVISKKDNKYFGTLIWTHIPGAVDLYNPDKTKRNNKVAGSVILKDFEYTGEGVWEEGTVYDPESGKTYSGKITIDKEGNLRLRGYVGFSAFGRTTMWTRVK